MNINNTITFGRSYTSILKRTLTPKIKSSLPYGKITSVRQDAKGILVKQKDGRAKMISRFIDGKLRESTEYIDGNKYKLIYSQNEELMKKIQQERNQKRTFVFKDGIPYSTLDIMG